MEAEELLKAHQSEELIRKIILLDKPFVSKEDVEPLIPKPELAQISRTSDFTPIAKEYDSNIKLYHSLDVTGKSRTKGEVDNFIAHFRNRFERLARMLRRSNSVATMELADVKRHVNEKARVIVLISDKKITKKGNILFDVEDMSGTFKVVISNSKFNEKVAEKAKNILIDDVVAITGKVLEPYIIAEEIEWPDLPVIREKKQSEIDVATVYLSDLHFGSRYFLGKPLKAFTDWLHGRGEMKELAGKVKYICIAGDIVDGIGIYPNQERELVVKDIYQQYKMFDDFVEDIPDHIDIIVAPGNHDAVRRGEPQPALPTDLVASDVIRVGNPSTVSIEGFKHLMYHGTSMDSM
ncbi:MAG: metallophosphoesterase, partial [Nitrososphaera sp.]|nr:metallophosphoesterase [Nitrososphaera sp.]